METVKKYTPDDEVPKRAFPPLHDRWHYLYVEQAIIERDEDALLILSEEQDEETPVPIATLALLALGPGTSITDQAIKLLGKNKTALCWVGEHGVRMYAGGLPMATSCHRLLVQAHYATHEPHKTQTARKLFALRFPDENVQNVPIQALRGKEAIRVRQAYEHFSQKYNIPWTRRDYEYHTWDTQDPINRALSSAHACLYGVTHTAIWALGLSPALGFIHTGLQESFVYDVADIYKIPIALPIAFQETAQGTEQLERRVRKRMRDEFFRTNILSAIVNTLKTLFPLPGEEIPPPEENYKE
jgi:CRISPR-associated protein Cas1